MDVPENSLVVTLTVAQMHDLVLECLKELQNLQPKKEDSIKYLTRLEACEALKISLPTLSRYSDLGLIPAKKLGNRILYVQEDIQNALNNVPARKHK